MMTDKELFKEMYEENFKYVYSFVYARLAGNSDSVEDLVQSVFMYAFNSIGNFRAESSYRTWLCGIARHKIIDFYRKEISSYPVEFIDDLGGDQREAELEDIVVRNDVKSKVIKTLNELPSVYRYAIVLKYIDNYSVKDIADIMGRTPKAIDGILQRAKLKFKNEFLRLEGERLHER